MNICRICLSGGLLKDIFDTYLDKSSNNKNRYVDIINTCLGIQITAQITTTTKLCTNCVRKLISFFKFKSLALKNHDYLQTLHEDVVVKVEDITNDGHSIKCEEESISEDDSKEETKDSLNVKCEDAAETDIAATADVDIALTADIETSFADFVVNQEESDDELLSDLKKVKQENERKVKTKRKRGRPKEIKVIPKTSTAKKHVCVECGKVVKELREHMLLHLPSASRKRYPCPECDKVFMNKGSVKKHFKYKHLGIMSICTICNKEVRTLNQHMLTMHYKEKMEHRCAVCDHRFITKSKLIDHMTTHTKITPFECDICSKRFQKKGALQTHVRSVHNKEKTHLCQFCSKGFFQKNHLRSHLVKHSKEKPHECPDCGKYFKLRKTMVSHRVLHGGEKKYACELCDMKFMKQDYLNTHMKSHSKEKRYPCQYCGVKFGRSDHRKRHEYTAHQKHLFPSST